MSLNLCVFVRVCGGVWVGVYVFTHAFVSECVYICEAYSICLRKCWEESLFVSLHWHIHSRATIDEHHRLAINQTPLITAEIKLQQSSLMSEQNRTSWQLEWTRSRSRSRLTLVLCTTIQKSVLWWVSFVPIPCIMHGNSSVWLPLRDTDDSSHFRQQLANCPHSISHFKLNSSYVRYVYGSYLGHCE